MKNAVVFAMAACGIVVSLTSVGNCTQTANSMVRTIDRIANPSEQSVNAGWVPDARQWEDSKSARTEFTGDRSYGDGHGPIQLALGESVYAAFADGSAEGTEEVVEPLAPGDVGFVPPRILERGHENMNYLVMVTMDGCPSCERMYPTMNQLREQGYIVYLFNINRVAFEGYEKHYKTSQYPTSIVMDGGKETFRRTGMVSKFRLKLNLKTKEEQKEEEQKPIEPVVPEPVFPEPIVPDEDPYGVI